MDSVMDIDPDGDVTLICSGEEKQKKLRVASSMLVASSPVFKSLLSPRFLEGTRLNANGTVEIALFDDDADSMVVLCRVLHLQNDKVPVYLSIDDLLAAARLSDKYNLGRALKPTVQGWLSRLETQGAADRALLLLAAYYFEHEEMFAKIGRDLVVKCTEMELLEVDEGGGEAGGVMYRALSLLSIERTRILHSIASTIEGIVTAALTDDETHAMCEYRCVFVEKRLNFIMHQLRTDGLWPISGLERYSIEHVWRLLEGTRVTSANVYQSSKLDMCNQATCGGLLLSDSYDLGKIDDQIAKCLKDTWWNVKPVCYHCAREDKLSYPGCKHSER